MIILKTCRKAGHRWGTPTPIPYQGERFAGSEGWMEVRQCQRRGCRRYRVDYTDGSAVTYDTPEPEYAEVEDPFWQLVVVRK